MTPMLCRCSVVMSLVVVSAGSSPSTAEVWNPGALLHLQQLTRHGARSPKSNYADECPNDPFLYQWDSWNAQLTGPGLQEEVAVGTVTRQRYGSWLGPYNGSTMTLRCADSDRVLQSAQVAMSYLFPPGTGPEQGLPGRPTIVPIHTIPEEDDDLLPCPSAKCNVRKKADYKSWWDSIGAGILEAGRKAAEPLSTFCGNAATSNGVLKDQVDGFGFAVAQGWAVNLLTKDEYFAVQNLSMALQRGDFATDEARTYMAGDLPATLVSNMDQAISLDGSDQAPQYMGYFTHRHAHMALADFLGWGWMQYGVPAGQVMTGTTVWIELRRGQEAGQYDVALLQWIPHCGKEDISSCPVQPIALPGCSKRNGTLCSIEEFRAIVSQRIARTGNWQTLCNSELMV